MMNFKYTLILLLSILCFASRADVPLDEFCGIHNTTTQDAEQLIYNVFYNVAGIYVNAGTAVLSNSIERINGHTVYHIVADGQTNSSYDWIYKVRDRYETYMDTGSMQPVKFIRNISEGGYKKYENITFNRNANTAVTGEGVYKVPACIQDVVSAIYYARNIDFNHYNVGDRIPFSMFLDNEVYSMYIRYLGKETVKTRYGKFRAIKFK